MSFLGTLELLSTYEAFNSSLMEYCSTIWVGSNTSHNTLHGKKAFKIIVISHYEVESVGLSFCHRRQVGGLCVLPPPFWYCTFCSPRAPPPQSSSRVHTVHHHLNLTFPSMSWRQLFTAISDHLQSKTMIFPTFVKVTNFRVFPPWNLLFHACVFSILFFSVRSWSVQCFGWNSPGLSKPQQYP